jgi:hypothetical protein
MSGTAIRPFAGPHVWTDKDIGADARWRRELGPGEITTLDRAVKAARAAGIPWDKLTPESFPLPGFEPIVREIREELENGSGIFRLGGVPVERYDMDDVKRLYFGTASHIGTLITQNRHGEMMRAIRDEGGDVGARYGQIKDEQGTFLSSYARTLSSGSLRFHTDRCDVVSLLCVGQAARGGHSRIASICAVHNAMLARRPDLVELLYGVYWRSRLGEEEGGENLAYPLPVFAVRDGKFTSHYSRTYVEAAQKIPGIPKLTAKQDEALDLLAETATVLSYEMIMRPGDWQFLNNHVIYHARDPFEDDPKTGQVRNLLRLWLSMPNSRALPENHRVLWRHVEAGAVRGGIQPRVDMAAAE